MYIVKLYTWAFGTRDLAVLTEITDQQRTQHPGGRPGGQQPPVYGAHHFVPKRSER